MRTATLTPKVVRHVHGIGQTLTEVVSSLRTYPGASRFLTFVVSLVITYSLYDQANMLWRTRSSKDFARSLVITLVANEFAWFNYGYSIKEWPIIVLGALNIPAVLWLTVGYIRSKYCGRWR